MVADVPGSSACWFALATFSRSAIAFSNCAWAASTALTASTAEPPGVGAAAARRGRGRGRGAAAPRGTISMTAEPAAITRAAAIASQATYGRAEARGAGAAWVMRPSRRSRPAICSHARSGGAQHRQIRRGLVDPLQVLEQRPALRRTSRGASRARRGGSIRSCRRHAPGSN